MPTCWCQAFRISPCCHLQRDCNSPLGATIVVDMENYPCSQIAKVVEQHHPGTQFKVVQASMHKRGVTAWVEREGVVKTGDAIKIVTPPNRLYPHA